MFTQMGLWLREVGGASVGFLDTELNFMEVVGRYASCRED